MNSALSKFSNLFTPPWNSSAGRLSIPLQTGSADSFIALSLATTPMGTVPNTTLTGTVPNVVLVVVAGMPNADAIFDDLTLIAEKLPVRILEFPPLIPNDKSSLGVRLKTIAALKAWGLSPYPAIVVAPFQALVSPIPMGTVPAIKLGTVLTKEKGTDTFTFADICSKFAEYGYKRVPMVESEGDWAVRGGIIDAWSPGDEFPVRAEFFGEELESLRNFDAASQRSIKRISSAQFVQIEVAKALETQTEGDSPHDFDGGGQSPSKLRGLSPFDLLPDGAFVYAIDHNAYSLSGVCGAAETLGRLRFLYSGDPAPQGIPTYSFLTSPLPGFSDLGANDAHHPELFDAARERLEKHLDSSRARGDFVVKMDDLSGGFELPGFVVVAKSDRVFAKHKTHVSKVSQSRGARLNDFDELEPGEYVVHVDYGVGRFIGSSEIEVAGKRSEVFSIEYADGAKLHVPATHAHLLSRYVGVRGQKVRLHRLDGKRWSKDKADAQKAVIDLASTLLDTQARRETMPGFAYDVECDGIEAFEAAFPYMETPDQLAAIAAIKKDLASHKPMDRLVCGDAGYGKTEVAMRAAYIAAMNGKQTVLLAPTTVLAEQHFETFSSRFDGTPIRIEPMSRFQSHKTHQKTSKRIENGACDIVIGTHAVLSPRITFHDLGLIIIDEEQRFGVRHKEWLKRIRTTADVLTLSATPIPRTLYLSMTGARDLSLLRSPPSDRVAVETTIIRDSDEMIRAAIEAEVAQGGQVFFLHNRVTTIHKVEKRLKSLCPQIRIVVAHGQMEATELARKMRDFEKAKYDLLLSTTIVESGIDIPRANTILIDQAHTFGLADLYQLRGRVGRSSKQGRAIFLLPADGLVDSDARERLAALKKHGGLGAGFNLAVRDLELRGAGNLLGSQQSGHIAAIGFGLYCQLLKRTISVMKGEKVSDVVDVRVNLDFIDPSPASDDSSSAAALPYGYVEENAQRIEFMKRLAEASNVKAIRAIAEEMTDRFGPMPAAAKRLIRLAELKIKLADAQILRLFAKGDKAFLYKESENNLYRIVELPDGTADEKISRIFSAIK